MTTAQLLKKVTEELIPSMKMDTPVGRYDISEDLYYLVQEYETKDLEEGRYEAHIKFIDIQLIVGGKEAIYVAVTDGLENVVPYDQQKDAAFYAQTPECTKNVLEAGDYIVLYPQDAHMACITEGEKSAVKKVVFKVRIK